MDTLAFELPWADLLAAFALFLRVAAFISVAPVIGADTVPARVRAALGVLIAIVLVPIVPPVRPEVSLVSVALSECLVGLVLGFSARIVIDAAFVAGVITGFPTGISMASMLDPVTQASSPVLAIFYRVLGGLVFCSIGGHHAMLNALAQSYELVPCGGATLKGDWVVGAGEITGRVLILGLRIAAPVLVAGLLADIALMLVARAVPQMNILAVGAPVRLTVGLIAIAFSLQLLVPSLRYGTDATLADGLRLAGSMAGGR